MKIIDFKEVDVRVQRGMKGKNKKKKKKLFVFSLLLDVSFSSLLKQEQGSMNKMNFWLEETREKTGNYDGSSSCL